MQPSVWGPHVWRTIHYIALGYPDNADSMAYKEFFLNLWKVIPCLKCSINYKRHLDELPPIDQYLGSKDDLFKWTVALHNIVNMELGKPQMDVDTARALYSVDGLIQAPVPAPVSALGPKQAPPTLANYLLHNIAIVTLIFIVIMLLIFLFTQKKHVSK